VLALDMLGLVLVLVCLGLVMMTARRGKSRVCPAVAGGGVEIGMEMELEIDKTLFYDIPHSVPIVTMQVVCTVRMSKSRKKEKGRKNRGIVKYIILLSDFIPPNFKHLYMN
jgi:hypothetical protein